MDKSGLKRRVLLGMSGGTDSSVSAVILQEQGFEVIGVTFIFSDLEQQNKQNINDAKAIAKILKIEHKTIDLRTEFREKIIERFIKEYEEGKTPFPCAFCNPELKFKQLNNLASELNCDFIATGHYATITEYNQHKYIAKGKDAEKDQSFFLWGLESDIINKLIFPLGFLHKTGIRKFAQKRGFSGIAKKRDSLGICFIEGNDYRKYLKDKVLCNSEGYFVDIEGNNLGKHAGIVNYTIGQRRGLGLNLNQPVFVSEIRASENEIVLSNFEELYKTVLYIRDTHFTDFKELNLQKEYIVKIRYRLQETPCKLNLIGENHAKIQLLEPVAMVANGQTAVIYEEDRVLGGGFIEDSD